MRLNQSQALKELRPAPAPNEYTRSASAHCKSCGRPGAWKIGFYAGFCNVECLDDHHFRRGGRIFLLMLFASSILGIFVWKGFFALGALMLVWLFS